MGDDKLLYVCVCISECTHTHFCALGVIIIYSLVDSCYCVQGGFLLVDGACSS